MAKQLPGNITSYDLLKAFAILSMICDHVGYYFFDDQDWWRVAGRLCVPIWFFLIGYADSRDIGPRMWLGGIILVLANMMVGMWLFPLNVLFSMLVVRLCLDRLMQSCKTGYEGFIGVIIALLLLTPISYSYWEYGTEGVLMAMFGFLMKNRPQVTDVSNPATVPKAFALFCLSQFIFIQGVLFGFNLAQMIVLSAGVFAVTYVLYFFRPMEYAGLTQKLPRLAVKGLQFLGRRTLEIYVAHLILFKFMMMAIEPGRFSWFHPTLMIP
ncbi:MAG: putative rane protein [Micavibrio sp.]|nr:putative rane protein [Micavibrio sp.]